jgi:hypothetical protein
MLQGFKTNAENSLGNSNQYKLNALGTPLTTAISQPVKKTATFTAMIFSKAVSRFNLS